MLNLDTINSGELIDNHIMAIENSDLTIAINYEESNLFDKIKKQKKLHEAFDSNNSMIIDVPKTTNRDIWNNIANTIESACRDL